MKFPQVSGSNLLRERLSLPQDFKGQFNLLFVPFQQWQQMEVDFVARFYLANGTVFSWFGPL